MKTNVEELPGNRVRLDVEVPEGDVKHALEHAASDLAASAKIPGFRKGKAPLPLIVARFGREAVWAEAVRSHLDAQGFIQTDDGLHGEEGAFLACSFWLADNYVLLGRADDARRLFERVLALRNDVGLLAEEYDTRAGRQVGNFPQAFSHMTLVDTAFNLNGGPRPAVQRATAGAAGDAPAS